MAIINRLRFVDTLRERPGDDISRDFTKALQDEIAPLMTKEEIQMMIAGMVDQIEARLWRIIAIATGLIIGTMLTAIGIATGVLIAVLN